MLKMAEHQAIATQTTVTVSHNAARLKPQSLYA
jgi:hypothetical protein